MMRTTLQTRANLVILSLATLVGLLVPLTLTQVTFAAGGGCSKPHLFGLETWYAYLPYGKDATNTCAVTLKANNLLGVHSPFLLIALAIIDDLIRIAALVAVGYVIYGGIQYMTSGGSPDATKRAQNTIINALIGLVIAILAAAIVAFIGNQLGG